MNIKDLDKHLQEYMKHFGSKVMGDYFKQIIKIREEKTDATSKKKVVNSSRSN